MIEQCELDCNLIQKTFDKSLRNRWKLAYRIGSYQMDHEDDLVSPNLKLFGVLPSQFKAKFWPRFNQTVWFSQVTLPKSASVVRTNLFRISLCPSILDVFPERNKLYKELGFPDEVLLDLTKSDYSRINSMRDKVNGRAQL